MRTRITTVAITAGLLLATLTACGSSGGDKPVDPKKLDDAATFACDDFAHGYEAALTSTARIDLANKVNKWAQDSGTNGIADNGKALARGSEGSATAWKMGADAFANACLEAGWKA
jgi:hypothetical protein